MQVLNCPACNSPLRQEGEELEIVSIDLGEERWAPTGRRQHESWIAVGIVTQIAREHGFTLSELRSARKLGPLVEARAQAARAVREQTNVSLTTIASILNHHHTTILYHLRPQEELVEPDHWLIGFRETSAAISEQEGEDG
jgi:chromosomal replication initiation ATPase DnaA